MTAEQKGDRAEGERSAESKKINVSMPQVAGGALASVTAAFLGSSLGAAGTLWGAGLTSVVITVGGAVYERSLEKTKHKAKDTANRAANKAAASAALNRARGKPLVGGVGSSGVSASAADGQEPTRRIQPVSGPSVWHWPGGEQVDGPEHADQPTAFVSAEGPTRKLSAVSSVSADSGGDTTAVVSPPAPRRRIRWTMLAVTSAAIFGLGMLVVTGFEGVTGRTLSGDGGTTVGQVFRPAAAPAPPQPEQPSEQPEPSSTVAPTTEPSEPSEPSSTPTTEAPPTTETGDSGNQQPTTTAPPTRESTSDGGSERSYPSDTPTSE